MNFLKKTNKDEIIYKAGYEDAERKLIPEWKQKLADLENEKDEIIDSLKLELVQMGIQLKNWKAEHEQVQKDKIEIRKEKSLIKREYYKINKFKDEIQESLALKLNEDAEKVQDVLSLLQDHNFDQIEG